MLSPIINTDPTIFKGNNYTKDLQTNKVKVNKEIRVTGKRACILPVSSNLYVMSSMPAAIFELASSCLKLRALPLDHVADTEYFKAQYKQIQRNIKFSSIPRVCCYGTRKIKNPHASLILVDLSILF